MECRNSPSNWPPYPCLAYPAHIRLVVDLNFLQKCVLSRPKLLSIEFGPIAFDTKVKNTSAVTLGILWALSLLKKHNHLSIIPSPSVATCQGHKLSHRWGSIFMASHILTGFLVSKENARMKGAISKMRRQWIVIHVLDQCVLISDLSCQRNIEWCWMETKLY